MPELKSYVEGRFVGGDASVQLLNPATEEVVAVAQGGGFDAAAAVRYAREKGTTSLHGMSFAERGELLARMAGLIHEHRDALIDTSVANGGTTRGGAKFDIDGASGTLAAYAELANELEGGHLLADGDGVGLGRGARLHGRHGYVAPEGVALLINAYNFPAWGFAEKAATALLAGMPVISKPATATAWTAAAVTELLVEHADMPEGAFHQVIGSVREVLAEMGPQDRVSFTGSSRTAAIIRGTEALVRNSVHLNVEADSLNATVLGPDVDRDSDVFPLFIRDVVREMTEKSGQKCTATRRVIVPEARLEEVIEELRDRLVEFRIGNPVNKEVNLGPLATEEQVNDVHGGMDRLRAVCDAVCGINRPDELIDVAEGKGFFAAPTLFVARSDEAIEQAHRDEVFGPCAVVIPYSGDADEATALVRRGGGMLVSSVYSDDRKFLRQVGLGIAPWCGRVVVVDSKSAGFSLPTGMVMPQLLHGGPGRAGGGEELGGIRGVHHYLHRVAFQGGRSVVERLFS